MSTLTLPTRKRQKGIEEEKEEENEEGIESLPLHSVELARQLLYQQKIAIKEYRERLANTQINLKKEKQKNSRKEKLLSVVLNAWDMLKSDVELLHLRFVPQEKIQNFSDLNEKLLFSPKFLRFFERFCSVNSKSLHRDQSAEGSLKKAVEEHPESLDDLQHLDKKTKQSSNACVVAKNKRNDAEDATLIADSVDSRADEAEEDFNDIESDDAESYEEEMCEIQNYSAWTSELIKSFIVAIELIYNKFFKKIENDENLSELSTFVHDVLKLQKSYDEFQLFIRKLKQNCASYRQKNIQHEILVKSLQEECDILKVDRDRLVKQQSFLRYKLGTQKENLNYTTTDEVRAVNDTENEALKAKLQIKEIEKEKILNEKFELLNKLSELRISSAMSNEQVLTSSAYIELENQCNILRRQLIAKGIEVETLQNELLNEVSKKDNDFEKLLNDTKNQKNDLLETIKSLQENLSAVELEKEKITCEAVKMKNEINSVRNSQIELCESLNQKNAHLQKIKQQYDLLKKASNQMLVKFESLRKEKCEILEIIKKVEMSCGCYEIQLKSLNSSEGNQSLSKSEKLELENKLTLLLIENQDLKRQLRNQEEMQNEYDVLKEKYIHVSEEVEEISKAFEDRLMHNEKLVHQLKEKEEILLNNLNSEFAVQTMKTQIQINSVLWEKKVNNLKQQHEKLDKLISAYVEAFLFSTARASLSDKCRDRIIGTYLETKYICESLHKEKEELLSKLSKLEESNKLLEEDNKQKNRNQFALKSENMRLLLEKNESEKELQKSTSKEDLVEKKSTDSKHSENEFIILQQENKELRRRIICTVCAEHFRDHIIAKCGHLFCKECLEKNIRTRNRKCPQCNLHFDQKDIKRVFLD